MGFFYAHIGTILVTHIIPILTILSTSVERRKKPTGVYCQILKLVHDTRDKNVIDEMPDARYQIGCQIPDAR